jgi:hypothetical protein
MAERLTDAEKAEIRARVDSPRRSARDEKVVFADRRKLLRELDWVTAERDAWRKRYYRMAEALGKAVPAESYYEAVPAEPYYDADSGCISVVGGKEPR